MDSFLRYAREKQKDIITLIREFIECESPSDYAPGVTQASPVHVEELPLRESAAV